MIVCLRGGAENGGATLKQHLELDFHRKHWLEAHGTTKEVPT